MGTCSPLFDSVGKAGRAPQTRDHRWPWKVLIHPWWTGTIVGQEEYGTGIESKAAMNPPTLPSLHRGGPAGSPMVSRGKESE